MFLRTVAATLAAMGVWAGTAGARQATVERHPVYGGAQSFFGDCPEGDPVPPAGTVCTESFIIGFHGYDRTSGGSVSPAHAPLVAYAETDRLHWTGAEEPAVTVLRFGFGEFEDASLTVNTVTLENASLRVAIPMSDGSTFDFTGTWTATSDRFLFGNDGPATGLPHLVVDPCHTFVANGHQKFTEASMTGTLNGVAVQSYPWWEDAAFIFNNRFAYIDVQHASCS